MVKSDCMCFPVGKGCVFSVGNGVCVFVGGGRAGGRFVRRRSF